MTRGNFIRSERSASGHLAENVLREHKKNVGEVVYIAISARTTLELPAHLSQEERDVRIENYKKRHRLLQGGW